MSISQLEELDGFDLAVSGPVPTLVQFTADWCGPCKAMAPAVAQVAEQLEGRMEILKVDIDAHPSIPERYGVRSVPTFILFEEGEQLIKRVGSHSREQLLKSFEPLL